MAKKVRFRWPIIFKILYAYVSVIHRLYYRKITIVGAEKIPSNTPVIFAPNHQNALMDAFGVMFPARRHVVFMARADIFKKPAIAKILNMLQILPIYRIRDGYGELGRNQEVFDTTVEVLKSNIPLCILPEGNHEGLKRLRPLKKGIFRIAFQSEESNSFNLNLHIIPVGLDYSDYFNAGADLTVVFGTPIKVADYETQYRENEQKTINELMQVLAKNMRSVMIHIPEEHYELTYRISELYEPDVWDCSVKRQPFNKLTAKQYIVQKVTEAFNQYPEKAVEIGDALIRYNTKLSEAGIEDCLLQQKSPHFIPLLVQAIISMLLIPIQVYGMILNYLPFKVPQMVASKIKDRHFQSSVQFGIGLFIFPVYYIILIILFSFLTDISSLVNLVFAISLPVTGYFAFYNYKYFKKLMGKFRIFNFRHLKTEKYNFLKSERNQIIDLIKSIINS